MREVGFERVAHPAEADGRRPGHPAEDAVPEHVALDREPVAAPLDDPEPPDGAERRLPACDGERPAGRAPAGSRPSPPRSMTSVRPRCSSAGRRRGRRGPCGGPPPPQRRGPTASNATTMRWRARRCLTPGRPAYPPSSVGAGGRGRRHAGRARTACASWRGAGPGAARCRGDRVATAWQRPDGRVVVRAPDEEALATGPVHARARRRHGRVPRALRARSAARPVRARARRLPAAPPSRR